MTDPAAQAAPGRRAVHSASALDKATARVVHVVTDEAVHQAFPFGDRKYTDLVARQTRQELEKMIKDRWETFTKTERFVELCNSLDDIEADAIARAGTNKPAHQIPTDPALSLPPLILGVIKPLLANYESLVASEKDASLALHAEIVKKAREAERLEVDVRARCDALQRAVDELEGSGKAKGNGVDWDRLRRTREEGAEMVGESGL